MISKVVYIILLYIIQVTVKIDNFSDFLLTFLEAVYLLVREGSSVALQFPLQPQPHLRILVARGVVLRITVRSCLLLMRQ